MNRQSVRSSILLHGLEQGGRWGMLVAITGDLPLRGKVTRRGKTFAWLGNACQEEGLAFCVMTPRCAPKLTSPVNVLKYHGSNADITHSFVPGTANFSNRTVIYDAMYLQDLKTYQQWYQRLSSQLSRQTQHIFNPKLTSKDGIYRLIEKYAGDVASLPETKQVQYPDDVFSMLERVGRVWVKPIIGSGGRNMLYLEQHRGNLFRIRGPRFFERSVNSIGPKTTVEKYLRYGMQFRNYMVQAHVPLATTSEGRTSDFRVTVQRDSEGVWQTTAITLRLSKMGNMITNYHAGGSVISCTNWSTKVSRNLDSLGLSRSVLAMISRQAISAANALQIGNDCLGILGVDAGATADGRLFVYDFNSRPGRDILTDAELRHSLHYTAGFASYLSKRR